MLNLLDSLAHTYTWHELNDFIGFAPEDESHNTPDQLRRTLGLALGRGSHVDGPVEWYLSHLIENISRFALQTTLLGGCLVESYSRGYFEHAGHGIKGFSLGDMAKIVERHHILANTPSIENYELRLRRSRWFGFGRIDLGPNQEDHDGIPCKIMNKLIARIHRDVCVWDVLYGYQYDHPLIRERRGPTLLDPESGSESDSDASFDPSDDESSSEDSEFDASLDSGDESLEAIDTPPGTDEETCD